MKFGILVLFAVVFFGNQISAQSTVLSSINFSLDTNLLCSNPRISKVTYTGPAIAGIGYLPSKDFGDGYMVYSPEYTFYWSWDTGGTRIEGTEMGPFEINYYFVGNQKITLTVTSTSAPFEKVVISKEIQIYYPDLTAKWEDATCDNKKVKIVLNASGGIPPYQYSVDGIHFQDDSVFIVDPDVYSITIKDSNNCVASKPLTLNKPFEIWVLANQNSSICAGQEIQLSANSNASTFLWEPATGLDNPALPNPVAKPAITTQYIVTATNNDCMGSAKDTVVITVVPEITLNTTPNSEIEPGVPFQLNAWLSTPDEAPVANYTWSPPAGLSDPDISDPVATISTPIVYSVHAVTQEGCSADGQVKLSVTRHIPILVPAAFSPNGDGHNETLNPIIPKDINLLYFKIYNRWGEVIFSSNETSRGWDGRHNGMLATSGNYVYKMEGVTDTGRFIKKEGTFLLIR